MHTGSSSSARVGGSARRLVLALAALVVVAAGLLVSAATAAAKVPACTGNGTVQVAPYSCTSSRTIDGTVFTVVLHVGADRAVTVDYTLDAPRAVATPIRVQSHVGLGGGPPPEGQAVGEIPPGTTSATLAVILQCGQIDIKAVTLGNGVPTGRIAAPFVTTSNSCAPAPATTSPPTTIEATSVPATTAPATTPVSAAVLPATACRPQAPAGWTARCG